jgi:hypothetical protein
LVSSDRSGAFTRGEIYIEAGNASNNTANGFIQMLTNNSPRVTITNGGNLLVGTTTDAGFKLDVNGTGRFSSSLGIGGATSTNGFLEVFKSGGSIAQFSIGQNSTYHTDFFVDASGNFYVQPQGNTALTIASTGAATFSSSVSATSNYNLINNAGSVGALVFVESSVNKAFVQYLSPTFSTAARANSLELGTISSGSFIAFRPLDSEAMRITSGGNVLIGTETDVSGANLNVNGNIRTAAPSGATASNFRVGTITNGALSTNASVRMDINGTAVNVLIAY